MQEIRHVRNDNDPDRAARHGRHEFYIYGPTSEMTEIKRFARRHKVQCFAWKTGRKKYRDVHICIINDDAIATLFKLTF